VRATPVATRVNLDGRSLYQPLFVLTPFPDNRYSARP
jgi:hypothetical protein